MLTIIAAVALLNLDAAGFKPKENQGKIHSCDKSSVFHKGIIINLNVYGAKNRTNKIMCN